MKVAVLIGACCAITLGSPRGGHVQHEVRSALDPRLARSPEGVDGTTTVPVRIALKQRNVERGMEMLMEIADPDSPKYGQHYTAEQVADLFSPEPVAVSKVNAWLISQGVENVTISQSKGVVGFRTTVEKLEALLQTNYHIYQQVRTGAVHLGTDEYHLPSDVSAVVDFVIPGIQTSIMKKGATRRQLAVPPRTDKASVTSRPSAARRTSAPGVWPCSTELTPECIKKIYNITDGKLASKNNRLAITEFDDNIFSQSDLDHFFATYAPYIPKGTTPNMHIIDYPNNTVPPPSTGPTGGGEAVMDIEMAYPLVWPQGIDILQVGGSFEEMLDALDGGYCNHMAPKEVSNSEPQNDDVQCGTVKSRPHVISISYGDAEFIMLPPSLKRQCDEYMKLSLQGTTIVVGSGDGGVADGGYCLGSHQQQFTTIANTCPYLLVVGATGLRYASIPDQPEWASTKFSSGGGFSNVFLRPDYQNASVATYFANYDPGFPTYEAQDGHVPYGTDGLYNRLGRGIPDVSAFGEWGSMVYNGKTGAYGAGTSMSAPIFASILNRLNEERLALKKKTVGFVNVAFYKNPGLFTDITRGEQSAASLHGACDGKAFKAVQGWDPVTGLGTPNYGKMLEFFKNLP